MEWRSRIQYQSVSMTSLMGSRLSPITANLRGCDFRSDLFAVVGRAMVNVGRGVGEAGNALGTPSSAHQAPVSAKPNALTDHRSGAELVTFQI